MDEIKMDVQKMVKRRKDSGFTLIELMIVIAVIGILAVVLVPKVGAVKTSAKLAGVTTNQRSVAATVQGLVNYTPISGIGTKLNEVYSSSEIKNPITNATGVNTTGEANAAIVMSNNAPNTVNNSVFDGAVVVVLGADQVDIYGCDENGQLISTLYTKVTP